MMLGKKAALKFAANDTEHVARTLLHLDAFRFYASTSRTVQEFASRPCIHTPSLLNLNNASLFGRLLRPPARLLWRGGSDAIWQKRTTVASPT